MKKLPEFDELLKLSKEELEDLRKEYVEEVINSASTEDQKRKLRGLQFKIDMEREKSKNPMDACIKISKMMHDSFLELRDKLKELQENNLYIKNGKLVEVPTLKEEEKVPELRTAEVIEINKRLKDTE
jgi:hypothetical protein